MECREIGLGFIKAFCSGDISRLKQLLAPNLRFRGPYFAFDSRDEYIETLEKDDLPRCEFEVLHISEDNDNLSIFYNYIKSDGVITIAQLFKIRDQQIYETLLVFDGRQSV